MSTKAKATTHPKITSRNSVSAPPPLELFFLMANGPHAESYHCTYAKMWVKVKSVYSLSMRPEEKDAVLEMLNTCEEGDSQEVEL
jgi:hypothetical protein